MRLFEEILAQFGFGGDVAFFGAKFVVYEGKCAYFENVKSIASFSSERVEILLKKGQVRIEGENFSIARYGEGDLLLAGKVQKVEIGQGGMQ